MEEIKEQQVSLGEYIRVLYRGRWIILISFLIVMIATIYFTFTTQPVYEASALVMLKQDGGVQRQIFEVSSFMQKETMINNQVEILKSRSLAENVIHRLEESDRADSLWILGKGKNKEKFSLTKWFYSLLYPKGRNHEAITFDDIVKTFRENMISVVPKRDTDLIELKVHAFSPDEASFIANTWMEAYWDKDISESRSEVGEVRKFLEDKLKDVQTELTKSEETLKNYKETNSVAELNSETEQLIKQLAEFETMYQEAKTDLEANEKRLTHLKEQLDESQRALVDEATGLSSPVILELQKQLAQLIGEKASYEQQLKGAGYSTKDDAKLKSMEQRLKGLQEKISEETRKMVSSGSVAMNPLNVSESLLENILEIETENKSLKAKTAGFEKIVQQYNRELNTLPEKSLKLAQLQREAEVNNNIFMMLREKYEENRIAEAGQIGSVRIIDYAKPPKDPIKPKKRMNLILGLLVGLGLGVGITFVREYLDTSIKTIEDLEGDGFSVMGAIPFISSQKVSKHVHGEDQEAMQIESRLVTHFAPKAPISEAYRSLRTSIQYAKADQPIKTILVTSSGPGEGKSTSVANLAITFAQMGANTLLVDTDLRRPVLHGIFDMPRVEGLTNLLVSRASLEETIKQTKIENLKIITSGTLPPNPSELLASHSMDRFIEEVSSSFDIVLFDSPPVIAVTDAMVLAPKLDGIVLVVKSGETGKEALSRSNVLLNNVKANLFGIILNGVNVDHTYYYRYYYYYGDGKDKKKTRKKAKKSKVFA